MQVPTDGPSTPPTLTPGADARQTFRIENTTGNVTQPNADFINTILAIHNRERTLLGLPPLVWNNTLATDAKAWAEYIAAGNTGGKMIHCIELPQQIWEQIEECTHNEGENISVLWGIPDPPPPSAENVENVDWC